jgi:hypothetical protein
MEYPFDRAVADGVNVDFDLYTIRSLISEHGSVRQGQSLSHTLIMLFAASR